MIGVGHGYGGLRRGGQRGIDWDKTDDLQGPVSGAFFMCVDMGGLF